MSWTRYRLYYFVTLFFMVPIHGHWKSSWSIRLALFIDDAMWAYFRREHGLLADKELRRFVAAILDNVRTISFFFQKSAVARRLRLGGDYEQINLVFFLKKPMMVASNLGRVARSYFISAIAL